VVCRGTCRVQSLRDLVLHFRGVFLHRCEQLRGFLLISRAFFLESLESFVELTADLRGVAADGVYGLSRYFFISFSVVLQGRQGLAGGLRGVGCCDILCVKDRLASSFGCTNKLSGDVQTIRSCGPLAGDHSVWRGRESPLKPPGLGIAGIMKGLGRSHRY